MTTLMNWTEANAALERANSIILVTHVSPDGDAIGSLLGLMHALRERGKSVEVAVDGGVPDNLRFLPGYEAVMPKLTVGSWDLMISLDASDEERTGLVGAYARAHSGLVVNLDHHPTNTLFGDLHLVDPLAVAAAEIVLRWLEQDGHSPSQVSAAALLTGLVTDTLGFRTANVKPETLGQAQRLMEAGAPLAEIVAQTLVDKPFSSLLVWKSALPSLTLENGIVSAMVARENLREAGLRDTTDGGLISTLSAVSEAQIAVVFKELEDGRVEISIRSKPGCDISAVALALGGGGHKQAAGATVDGPLIEARARVLEMLRVACTPVVVSE
jgi:phosphoesterase RecJ-like protein